MSNHWVENLLIAVLSIGFFGCATFERSARSGYGDSFYEPSRAQDFLRERDHHRWQQGAAELGMADTQNLSDADQERVKERVELHRLERRLEASRERRQYFNHKPLFANDRERLYFLNLPGFEAREAYLDRRGLRPGQESHPDHIADLIEKSEVALGMSRKAVQESWGDPDAVEVAGDPVYGNERWKYTRMVANNSGFEKELRIIYFESGRVVGWERN